MGKTHRQREWLTMFRIADAHARLVHRTDTWISCL
jgi:hypothetical protein